MTLMAFIQPNIAERIKIDSADMAQFNERKHSGHTEPHHLRRLDWRFLLPEPNIDSVAVIGTNDEGLLQALQAHYSKVIPLDQHILSDSQKALSEIDLVIVRSPISLNDGSIIMILQNSELVYWEIDRKKWLKTILKKGPASTWSWIVSVPRQVRMALKSFTHYSDLLQAAGFKNIQATWHRPGFGDCLELIPLNHKYGLEYYFSRSQNSVKSALKAKAGRMLLALKILPRVISCYSIVASK